MNKIKKIIIVITLIISLLFSFVYADVGDFESYDSSWGADSTWDSSYDSSWNSNVGYDYNYGYYSDSGDGLRNGRNTFSNYSYCSNCCGFKEKWNCSKYFK